MWHLLMKQLIRYYNGGLDRENNIIKFTFTTAVYTPGSITSETIYNTMKSLSDAAGHNNINSLGLIVQNDCLGE